MFKNISNILFGLVLLHISITTLSNALVAIPIELLGYKITWSAFVFPLVVVATDLTVRLLGKSIATIPEVSIFIDRKLSSIGSSSIRGPILIGFVVSLIAVS